MNVSIKNLCLAVRQRAIPGLCGLASGKICFTTASIIAVMLVTLLAPSAHCQQNPYTQDISPSVLTTIDKSAELLKTKQFAAVEVLLLAAVQKLDAVKTSPGDLAMMLGTLCQFYKEVNRAAEAIPFAQRLVQADKRRFKDGSIFIAEDLRVLGESYLAAKKYDDSAQTFQEALKIAIPASEADYFPCIVAAASNTERKSALIQACYEGVVESNCQPTRQSEAEHFFSAAIGDVISSKDNPYKFEQAQILFKHYREFLKNTNQTDKAEKFEEDVKSYEKTMSANREYQNLPAD